MDDKEWGVADALAHAAGGADSAGRKPGSALAVAGIVLGIVSCVLNGLLITAPFGLITGLIGLILSAVARNEHGEGRAGLLLNAVALGLLVIWAATFIALVGLDPTLL